MSATPQSNGVYFGGEPNSAELDGRVPFYDTQRLLDQLGDLSPAEYGQRRKQIAADLDTPVGFLDTEYKERHKRGASLSAERNVFGPIEQWPAPVSGASLLRSVVLRLKRHIIFDDEAATAVALWIAFAWTHDAATYSPLLLVTSAEMNSGKTTLLGLVRFLVPRPLFMVEISSAVLYRAIEKWTPTLIVDEADAIFKQNPELRAVVNSGWTRGMGVPRCHPETHEPEIFSTFGPKAIGMKGRNLPDTTLGRSIVIEMRRKKSNEHADNFEHVDDDEFITTRRLLARWAADNVKGLIAAKPALPEGFQNRLAANWRPLLAIADVAGGEWPALARTAAKALSNIDTESEGTALLSDIKSIFAAKAMDRLASADLVAALHALEDRDDDAFEERAAILEFNEGLTRERADAQARLESILDGPPLPTDCAVGCDPTLERAKIAEQGAAGIPQVANVKTIQG